MQKYLFIPHTLGQQQQEQQQQQQKRTLSHTAYIVSPKEYTSAAKL